MNLPPFASTAAPVSLPNMGWDRIHAVSLPAVAASMHPTTLVELLRLRAMETPNRRAFSYAIDGEHRFDHMTYGELDTQARAIAARLQQAGYSGGRALLLYPSGLEFVSAFFGCQYAGVVAVPAYPPRRNRNAGRVDAVVRDAQASVVLSTEHALVRTDRVVSAESELRSLPWWSTDSESPVAADTWQPPKIDATDLAFLQYTSGSTGDPKGVMLSHRNLMQNSAVIREGFQTSSDDMAVFWLPLYHDMGLIGGVLQPIYAGTPCTLMSPAHFLQQPLRWLRVISSSGATVSGGPNFAYDLCVERITDQAKKDLDLSRWSLAFNGAEPVRAETLDRFAEKFASCGFRREAFYPCYGLAESTLLVAGGKRTENSGTRIVEATALQQGKAVPFDESTDAQSLTIVECGKGLFDQDVRVVDPERKVEVAEGEIGEIWVSGGSIAAGYWKRPEASRETFEARLPSERKRFLRTGDLGFLVAGKLHVTGRRKELIILRGVNHYPHDIEQTARDVDPILMNARCAAMSVETDQGEQLVVLQEIARRFADRAQELQAAIERNIAQVHDLVPADVVMVLANSLPKTSSGKLQRFACREEYLEGKLTEIPLPCKVVEKTEDVSQVGDSDALQKGTGESFSTEGISTEGVAATSNAKEINVSSAVYEAIREVAKERARRLADDTDLVGLGLDSLERMEIVATLEDRFGGRFSEEAILDMETPADVVRAVEEQLLSSELARKQPVERAIEPGDYDFSQSPEYQRLLGNIRLTEQVGLDNPYFTIHDGITNDQTTIEGRKFINFCSYNYLGMSGDPMVTAAAQEATARYGTSVSASRLVSGEKPLHQQLENSIANFLGAEAAITMVGGHATNETTIGHLFGPGDLILHDALSHNSIVQGCRLSGARRRAFPHNDSVACRELLERYRGEHRRVLIVIEGVYSMDGDIAPLPDFVELKEKHQAYLMVDEAHSLGTLGEGGRGIAAHFGVDPRRVDLWMGTLSKSLGSCGGYIAARKEIVEYLKYTAPGFVYSVGLSPANTAAALASLQQLRANPERVERLRENSALFLALANEAGLDTGASRGTPVIPVITGSSVTALQLSDRLFKSGINVQPILHPAVEDKAARLRFFMTCDHSEEQIRHTVALTAKHWQELQAEESAA